MSEKSNYMAGVENIKAFIKEQGIYIDNISKFLKKKKKVVVICGPTCSGKSKTGIILAKLLDTDIISMDSMQVYRGMDIGTDKYNTENFNIKQYMVSIFDPDHNLSVVEFSRLCDVIIKEKFFSLNKIPLLVGGSGLYIRSVVKGIDSVPAERRDVRERLKKKIKKYGIDKYYLKLKEVDSNYAEKISRNDSRRIVRALEVYETTGLPFSDFQKIWKDNERTYDSLLIGIEMERGKLYSLIENRVEIMFKNGLVKEVKNLINRGYGNCRSIMQAVGYKEVVSYLRGETALQDCIDEVKKNTRRLAKKQMTWFNSEPDINWIRADNYDNICELIVDILRIIEEECVCNEKN